MKFCLLPFLVLFAACAGTGSLTYTTSADDLLSFGNAVETDFLKQHLEVISHDSLEGRGTGTRGIGTAAEYLAAFYEDLDFTPPGDNNSFFQHYDLNASITDSLVYRTYRIEGTDTLHINHTVESEISYGDYFQIYGGSEPIAADVVFAGFGVNDAGRDVHHLNSDEIAGKWVLIFDEIPYVAGGDTLVSPGITANNRSSQILRDYGALGILLISEHSGEQFNELARLNSKIVSTPQHLSLAYRGEGRSRSGFPAGYKYISRAMAAQMLGLQNEQELMDKRNSLIQNIKEFRPYQTGYFLDYTPYHRSGTIEAKNVLAYLEGADPDLKNEAIVLMAHYDHVGIGNPDQSGDMIYNGADDNGSGTVALMAIANALNEARLQGYKPKRSVLFLHVSGEEVGLLGSRYYSDHPVIPIEQTVANFNADMIGRSDPESIEAGDTDYVYLIGGEIISSGLDSLVVSANEHSVNMRLDRRYNDLTDRNQFYRRSDHWNFGRLGVPFVFFFTGVHADYHRPSDTFDKIDFDKYTRVVQLIYASTIKVTSYDGRPEVDNQEFIDITGGMAR